MSPIVAAAFLIAYYILSIEIYLATYCVGRFQMSFWGLGPTELRIVLAIGALMLFVKPVVTVFGVQMALFDAGGIVARQAVRHCHCLGRQYSLATPQPHRLPFNTEPLGWRKTTSSFCLWAT
jgi:hypothetical protein